jgi:D-amino-acid dehydrogenase
MAGSPYRGADIVVIGAGAVGASIAYESARRGASVLVLDGGAGPWAGCSYANAGLLSPAHVEPLATPKNVAAGIRFLFSPHSPFHVHPDPRLLPWLARFVRSAGPSRVRRLTARMQRGAGPGHRLPTARRPRCPPDPARLGPGAGGGSCFAGF